MKFPRVPGLTVTICVDGVPVEEHDHESEDPTASNTVERYIEAKSGATFEIKVGIAHDFLYAKDELDCKVYLDGQHVVGYVIRPHQRPYYEKQIQGRKACVAGQWTRQRFMFADLETNDGPAKASFKDKLKDLGSIEVKLVRAIRVGASRSRHDHGWSGVGKDGVPEKGLKGRAISKQATLGTPEVCKPSGSRVHVEYPYGATPFAQARFKYRSHRDLQIEDIIPRSPSPLPLEDRDPDDLSPEEARELVRRLRRQQVVKQEFKQEKRAREPTVIEDDNSDDDEPTIALENVRRKRARLSGDNEVEVIDLCGED